MKKTRIVVVSTGGTIASAGDDSGRARSGALAGAALLQKVPVPEHIELEVCSLLQRPSNAMTWDDWLSLKNKSEELAQSGVQGMVVTHGTDTLEDTAYFLQCVVRLGASNLVVTGSQRIPQALGTDAYTNLRTAITLAASDAVQGCGVLVAFNENFFSASTVRKINTFQLNGFGSPGLGSLGYVDGDKVQLLQTPALASKLELGQTKNRVDILSAAAGSAPELIDASRESGAQGLVVEGLGRGHVPPSWVVPIERCIQKGLPVVIVSSCLYGPLKEVYEFDGSLHHLSSLGVIQGQGLTARRARIRLMIALSNPSAYPDIRAVFA